MTNTQLPSGVHSDLELEVAMRIGRAWRDMRRGSIASDVRDAIYGVGGSALDPGQMDALDFLVMSPSCRMSELAEYLRIDPSSATRAVQRLIKDNLAERVEHEGDGRVVAIAATERGRKIHEQVANRRRELIFAVLEEFNEEEQHQFAEFLERFLTSVDSYVAKKKRRHR
jgi:DNA-binding MarR family transcriptional regulator